ncbi:MAG: hypothetical protein ACJAX5_003154, partial [Patiriisocius sp.]
MTMPYLSTRLLVVECVWNITAASFANTAAEPAVKAILKVTATPASKSYLSV